MATDDRVRLHVAGRADASFLDGVHETLAELWTLTSTGDEDRMLFELAVVEVASNIVQHGTTERDDEVEVRLDLEASAADLVAMFRDSADPPILDLTSVTLPDASAEAGRGLALALAALDDLTHLTDDGNTWLLRRRRRDVRD